MDLGGWDFYVDINWANIIFYLVSGVIGFVVLRRFLGQTGKADQAELQRLGLRPSGREVPGGSAYEGEYGGRRAGYNQGAAMVHRSELKRDRSDSPLPLPSGIAGGCEFWLGLSGEDHRRLAVVERKDKGLVKQAQRWAGGLSWTTGEPAFDRRFLVLCADPTLAARVFTSDFCQSLAELPHVALLAGDGRVSYVVTAEGAKRLNKALKLPGRSNGMRFFSGLLGRGELFFEICADLADALHRARLASQVRRVAPRGAALESR